MAEFKGKQGHWVTTESGSHLFIESGGSFEEAVEQAFGKENAKKYKKYEEEDKGKNPNTWSLEDIKNYYEDNAFGFNVKVKKDKLVGYDAEGEEIDWDLDEARYNVGEFMKDNGDFDEEFDNDYDAEFGEDEEDQKFRDFSNKINELNISDEKKKYFQSELEKTANNVSETYQTIEQVYDDAQNEEFDSDNDLDPFIQELYDVKTQKELEDNLKKIDSEKDLEQEAWQKEYDKNQQEFDNAQKEVLNKINDMNLSKEQKQYFTQAADEISRGVSDTYDNFEQLIDDVENEAFDSDNDFDNDLEAAFKKHGADEDAILDELRASGKDYGMSNGDLQAVVEAYVMNHEFDDDEILSKWIKK